MKKIAFLKLNDVKVSLDFFQHMSINEISKKLFQLQLKHSSNEIKSIFNRYFSKQVAFEFKSFEIACESYEKRRFFKSTYQDQSVLFFDFHITRIVCKTKKKYARFDVDINQLGAFINAIHKILIAISS